MERRFEISLILLTLFLGLPKVFKNTQPGHVLLEIINRTFFLTRNIPPTQ
ncbi:unnamed protein product [Meloidogyne enterolobii]|uniref:Uncharacterized protein n=1 Tax=Meloidogyne enterolobii TaxID=390850 RepID=A0ACB0YUT0_MELEN